MPKTLALATATMLLFFAPPSVVAQESQPTQQGQDESKQEKPPSDFDRFGFGVGLGFRWNVFKPDVVDEAVIDEAGIVRVNKRLNTRAGFNLETHYLTFKTETFGIGPFVAVEAGADAVISSVGLGLLFAWKRSDNGSGFGLGFGYSAQPNTKVLGSEFVDGQPAPTDSTGAPLPIRYQQRDKGSLVLLLSALF